MSQSTISEPVVKILSVVVGVRHLRDALKALTSAAPPSVLGGKLARTFLACFNGETWVGAQAGIVKMLTRVNRSASPADGIQCFPIDRVKLIAGAIDPANDIRVTSGDGPVITLESHQANGLRSVFNLATDEPDGITLPEPCGVDCWEVSGSELATAIDAAKLASGPSSRYETDGIMLKASNEHLTIIGTDGTVMSVNRFEARDSGPDCKVFVPSEAVKALLTLAKGADWGSVRFRVEADPVEKVIGGKTEVIRRHRLSVRTDDVILEVYCPDASFPNLDHITGTNHEASIEFSSPAALAKVIEQAKKTTDPDTDGCRKLTLVSGSEGFFVVGGAATVEVKDVRVTGKPFERRFDIDLILPYLKSVAKLDNLALSVSFPGADKPDEPVRFHTIERGQFFAMPLTDKPKPIVAKTPKRRESQPVTEPTPVPVPVPTLPEIPDWVDYVRKQWCGETVEYRRDGSGELWVPSGNSDRRLSMETTERLREYLRLGGLAILTPEPVADPEPVVTITRSAACTTDPQPTPEPIRPVAGKGPGKPAKASAPKPDPMDWVAPYVAHYATMARSRGVFRVADDFMAEANGFPQLKAALHATLKAYPDRDLPKRATLPVRLERFIVRCVSGSPVSFPLPNPPAEIQVDAAEINNEVPSAISSVPANIKRVELLNTSWQSVGDTFHRSAPGCWKHDRTGSEIWTETMNHYHASNMVVFLPDPDRDHSGTNYGHPSTIDPEKLTDVVPPPADFCGVAITPPAGFCELPAISGGSPEASPVAEFTADEVIGAYPCGEFDPHGSIRRAEIHAIERVIRSEVADIMAIHGEAWTARESDAGILAVAGLRWELMTPGEREDFADWCRSIDYRPGEAGYGRLAVDEQWIMFLVECVEGVPIFPLKPRPTDPTDRPPVSDPSDPDDRNARWSRRWDGPAILPTSTDTPQQGGSGFPKSDRPVPVLPEPIRLDINGKPYEAEQLASDPGVIRITNRIGESYDVAREGSIITCSCPHYAYRIRGFSSSPCKHGRAIVRAGLMLST